MRKLSFIALLALLSSTAFAQLTLYVGRGEAFAQPVIDMFVAETGIAVDVRYGSTAELAVLISEEGAASPADVFWAQDAGALGALEAEGRLAAVAADIVVNVPAKYVHPELNWVAVSARSRVLAYSTDRVGEPELPASIFDLTDPLYSGRVAWAPGNASFQSFVTALRVTSGEDVARSWLEGMIANGAVAYSNNGGQLDGIAAGEVDFALVNTYYLPPRLADDSSYPVSQTFFTDGDIGNMANVTGIGVLASSDQNELAEQFVAFLLSDAAQSYFTVSGYEYPITTTVTSGEFLLSTEDATNAAPEVDLTDIDDLPGTLQLLTEVGLL